MRPPFFCSPPPHPGCSGILSATRSGTTPPTHTDSRLPDDTSVQHSLAPRPPLRRPNQPPTHTSCRASPRPPPRQTQKSGSRHRNRHPTSASSPAPSASPPPSRLGKSTLFLPRLPRPRRPEKRRPAPLSAPTHPPAPGKSSGARPHTSASSPTCTSLRLPAHAPHPSSPSRHPATPEKTSPRIPPAASPRLPAPPSASPPRQAQKKRQPAKGCRASFKPPGD